MSTMDSEVYCWPIKFTFVTQVSFFPPEILLYRIVDMLLLFYTYVNWHFLIADTLRCYFD
jgi:hypothetical protein